MTGPSYPEARTYSDMCEESLGFLEDCFRLAHKDRGAETSLEIGTRRGGSALLQLMLLEEMYVDRRSRPMLFTVDPYGMKPYNGGDVIVQPGLYGDDDYVAMRKLLAPFPNHAHFYMEGAEFLASDFEYWRNGVLHSTGDGYTFALLDGDHDVATIRRELHLVDADFILIDNVDKDPKTEPMIVALAKELSVKITEGPKVPWGAKQLLLEFP